MLSSKSLLPVLLMTSISFIDGSPAHARPIEPPSAGNIALALDRLDVVGTVLYVAAHPDDENTRFLAWLANARGLRAVYLSMTRGDGGQNLIGPDLGPMLGLIRTFELLAARKVDGAEQRFTRAVDFGYSKSADETLRIWGKDQILADVVAVMDELTPDVVVTRFSLEPPNHGHHTASAMLAREAFGKAKVKPARIFENKSSWRFKEGEDLSQYLAIDVGGYSPELGRTYTALAADSRTMHKSQGFGSAPTLGPALEYFEPIIADQWPGKVPDGKDPFAGLDFSWKRYPKTEAVRAAIAAAKKAYDPRRPEALVPALVKVHQALAKLPDGHPYKDQKLAETSELILAVLGLDLDVRAQTATAIAGEALKLEATALLRRGGDVKVSVTFPDATATPAQALDLNVVDKRERTITVPRDHALSTPFWLQRPPVGGVFSIGEQSYAPYPVGPDALSARFEVQVGGVTLQALRPARLAWVDQVHGERFRTVEVLPAVTLTPQARVRMFPGAAAQSVSARIRAHGAARSGSVTLQAPAGWKVAPKDQTFTLAADGETTVSFEVTPSGSAPVDLTWQARLEGGGDTVFAHSERFIDYQHVPRTTVLGSATIRATPIDLEIGGKRIGYIAGAGDDVALALSQVGYDVTLLEAANLANEDLSRFDALIAGIRAYNVHGDALKAAAAKLTAFMERGGTYLVQYVTSNRLKKLDVPIGPYPFTIEQGRVTDETAQMRVVSPASPFVQQPNKIGDADFAGWVQERGLYFADTWDPKYSPLFSANDPGDKPLEGAVLTTKVGKGTFVYTGLAFFRQLPDGVPGAYRLLANLLAAEPRKAGK